MKVIIDLSAIIAVRLGEEHRDRIIRQMEGTVAALRKGRERAPPVGSARSGHVLPLPGRYS